MLRCQWELGARENDDRHTCFNHPSENGLKVSATGLEITLLDLPDREVHVLLHPFGRNHRVDMCFLEASLIQAAVNGPTGTEQPKAVTDSSRRVSAVTVSSTMSMNRRPVSLTRFGRNTWAVLHGMATRVAPRSRSRFAPSRMAG